MEAKRMRFSSNSTPALNSERLELKIWQNLQLSKCYDDNYINRWGRLASGKLANWHWFYFQITRIDEKVFGGLRGAECGERSDQLGDRHVRTEKTDFRHVRGQQHIRRLESPVNIITVTVVITPASLEQLHIVNRHDVGLGERSYKLRNRPLRPPQERNLGLIKIRFVWTFLSLLFVYKNIFLF